MSNPLEDKGISITGSILFVDTNRWMRQKDAIKYLRERGHAVYPSLLNYWQESGKIDTYVVEQLGDLLLIDVTTAPPLKDDEPEDKGDDINIERE